MRLASTSLLLLTGVLGCADVLGLDAYGTGGASTGGAGGTTSTGGAGGTTSTAGNGGGGTTSTGGSTSTGGGGSGGTTSTGGGGSGGTTSTGGGGTGGTTSSSTTSTTTTCTAGDTQPCYTGPPGTEGIGVCKPGQSTCDAAGTWGACVGESLPELESCSTTAIDESCDQLAECTGQLRWVRHFPAVGSQEALAMTVDVGDNHLVTVGYTDAAIDFGGGVLPFVDKKEAFVVRLDSTGKHVWSKAFVGTINQAAEAVAIDVDGNVFVAGTFGNGIDIDGTALDSAGGDDIFVVKLDREGVVQWTRSFGAVGAQRAHGIAVDAAGMPCFIGDFNQGFSIGPFTIAAPTALDTVVACLDAATGDPLWAKRYAGAGDQQGRAIAFDAAGDLYVALSSTGVADFGAESPAHAGSTDIVIAKLWKTDGDHMWVRGYGDSLIQTVNSLTNAGDGGIAFGASVQGTFAFGSVSTTGDTSYDAAVVKLDPAGNVVWAKRGGSTATSQYTWGITADSLGFVVAAGIFGGTVNLSGGGEPALVASTALDRWMVKLGPGGGQWWARAYPNASNGITWVGVDSVGRVGFAGNFQGNTDFGSAPLSTDGSLDVVIGQLAP